MITADKTSIYSQLKQSPEFESLPLMIKIKLYRLDKIITSGNINNIWNKIIFFSKYNIKCDFKKETLNYFLNNNFNNYI